MDTVEAVSPVTGRVMASFPVATAAEVERAVSRARAACAGWGQTPLAHRLTLLARLRNLLVNDIDQHEQLVAAATGKPDLEALAGDLLTCIDFIQYYEKHAAEILQPEERPGGILYGLSKTTSPPRPAPRPSYPASRSSSPRHP